MLKRLTSLLLAPMFLFTCASALAESGDEDEDGIGEDTGSEYDEADAHPDFPILVTASSPSEERP